MPPIISPLDAIILGIVEGITEFLPISSTGHLILFTDWLGLDSADPTIARGVNAFDIVIQAGALLAVLGMYLPSVRAMLAGLIGRCAEGRRLLVQLVVAFLPAAIIGPIADDAIEHYLFGTWPVVGALAVGGVLMIVVERWRARREPHAHPEAHLGLALGDMTLRHALVIGLAQCLAMWPGTSRSMVTMVAALILGYRPRAAAEFSFLLALPTLGGATVYKLLKDGDAVLQASGTVGLALGFVVSCVVAWLAVKAFLAYVTRHGMALFGWYRIALATVVVVVSLCCV
jgi:undecaprenyl-diphosphatase